MRVVAVALVALLTAGAAAATARQGAAPAQAGRGAPGVQGMDQVRVRWIGHALHAEANVEVDGAISTAEGHEIAEGVRHAMLHAAPWLRSVTVHVDPCHHDGVDHHAATSHHLPRAK